jgi:predicted unusual protein kinase regulating ubiquinone biosynthesis (AarF/ABC1/UbiB family)
VLTLARVDGERLVDYLAGAGAAARDHVLATLVRTTAEQIFVHGCFQADPHPGNFLVVSGDDPARPRLALLDFGCVATLDGPVRAAYARLCLSLFGGDGAGAAEGLAALGFVARDGDSRSVVRVADAMLAALRRGVRLDDPAFDPAAALADAFALARRHPVAAPAHFVLIGRVLATLGGLLFAHRPAIQPFALIAPALSGAAR